MASKMYQSQSAMPLCGNYLSSAIQGYTKNIYIARTWISKCKFWDEWRMIQRTKGQNDRDKKPNIFPVTMRKRRIWFFIQLATEL